MFCAKLLNDFFESTGNKFTSIFLNLPIKNYQIQELFNPVLTWYPSTGFSSIIIQLFVIIAQVKLLPFYVHIETISCNTKNHSKNFLNIIVNTLKSGPPESPKQAAPSKAYWLTLAEI